MPNMALSIWSLSVVVFPLFRFVVSLFLGNSCQRICPGYCEYRALGRQFGDPALTKPPPTVLYLPGRLQMVWGISLPAAISVFLLFDPYPERRQHDGDPVWRRFLQFVVKPLTCSFGINPPPSRSHKTVSILASPSTFFPFLSILICGGYLRRLSG